MMLHIIATAAILTLAVGPTSVVTAAELVEPSAGLETELMPSGCQFQIKDSQKHDTGCCALTEDEFAAMKETADKDQFIVTVEHHAWCEDGVRHVEQTPQYSITPRPASVKF